MSEVVLYQSTLFFIMGAQVGSAAHSALMEDEFGVAAGKILQALIIMAILFWGNSL